MKLLSNVKCHAIPVPDLPLSGTRFASTYQHIAGHAAGEKSCLKLRTSKASQEYAMISWKRSHPPVANNADAPNTAGFELKELDHLAGYLACSMTCTIVRR